jgi:hypothetical protein
MHMSAVLSPGVFVGVDVAIVAMLVVRVRVVVHGRFVPSGPALSTPQQ